MFDLNHFFVGINYWDSKNAIKMWEFFDEEVIRNDLKKIKECGITVLRVFPLWSLFQPLSALNSPNGVYEYAIGGERLPDTDAGKAGVSEEMCNRFARFCEIAKEFDLKLIVALLTGQMSFGLFVPPALARLNPITDAEAVRWEIRYIKYFVNRFKCYKSIVAWNPGNEVCALAPSGSVTKNQFFVWCNTIADAIKSSDNKRPIISGMPASNIENGIGNYKDIGEVFDINTAHVYNIFDTPYDSVNSIRSVFDSVFKCKISEGISKKPAFLEEFGATGYQNCSPKSEAEYYRASLFACLSNDCHGLMYWCAFDQGKYDYAPYDWNTIGSNYGFFDKDGNPKPIVREQLKFNEILSKLPTDFPKQKEDSVILLPRDDVPNILSKARTSYILALQAGLHPTFSYALDEIPDSQIYIFPSLASLKTITKYRWDSLLEKVYNGSILYISLQSALFRDLSEIMGIEFEERFFELKTDAIKLDDIEYPITYDCQHQIINHDSFIIATSDGGEPVYFKRNYGKGAIYLLTLPIETYLSTRHKEFNDYNLPDYSEFYKKFANDITINNIVSTNDRYLLTTQHFSKENEVYVTVVNYGRKFIESKIQINPQFHVAEYYGGNYTSENNQVSLDANDGMIFKLVRN